MPKLESNKIAYIGLRDVDEGEKTILKDFNIMHFWASDVKKMGISAVMDKVSLADYHRRHPRTEARVRYEHKGYLLLLAVYLATSAQRGQREAPIAARASLL